MIPQITHLRKVPYPDLPAVLPQPPSRPWNRKPKALPPLQRNYTSSLTKLKSFSTKSRSSSPITNLPIEILLLIMSNLDGVTSTCFGLASYRLYLVHFSVYGKVGMGENTVYTIEVLDGPWNDGGHTGFRMLGPMTMVKNSSLKQMLLPAGTIGRGGGRVWDAKLRYFRRMKEGEHENEGASESRSENEIGTDISSEDDGNQTANLEEPNEHDDHNRSFQLFLDSKPVSSTVLLLVTSQLGSATEEN